MADEKKPPTPTAPEATITITMGALQQLIKAGIAETMGKTFDDKMRDDIDRIRGRNVPPPPEELIACVSPLTGARFTARAIKSRSLPQGRIVELLDYVQPEGWNVHKEDGGMYDGDPGTLKENPQTGLPMMKFRVWAYNMFWKKDWAELSGKPISFLTSYWRAPADKAAE